MNNQKSILMSVLIFIGILVFSCNKRIKDDSNNSENDTELAKTDALAETSFTDVLMIADEASAKVTGDNLEQFRTTSNCATVTHDTISSPKTITIDFGNTNCMCNDGRNRRGIISVSYTGKYKDSGSIHTITFNNYFVNDNQVLGSKSVENKGLNNLNQTYFNVIVNGMIIKATTLDTITWNANRIRTWIAGEGTPTRMDDEYSISGSSAGQKANGQTYTKTITTPLLKEIGCKWFKSGVVEIAPTGKAIRVVDFGNGACDNLATVTVNGNVYNITLN
jgi:hypothetical protein